jgi:uncharacterized DUF497 family protein
MWAWDEGKRQANLAKHGVDFHLVLRFDWDDAEVEPDLRQDYGEERLRATGYIGTRLHILIYVEREGDKRLISLRKANRRELRKWLS